MRESIGGTWLFGIVILFVLLFTGYLCLAINYSRAYNVKNELVEIIERNRGVNDGTISEIDNYLNEIGYKTTGMCPSEDEESGWVSGSQFGFQENASAYCYRKVGALGTDSKTDYDDESRTAYYQVMVFFKIDLPVLNDAFTFSVRGDTSQIHFPVEYKE